MYTGNFGCKLIGNRFKSFTCTSFSALGHYQDGLYRTA